MSIKKFIDVCRENYIDNVTNFVALKKEACKLVCIWVKIYWFLGPEAQLILVPICARILGLKFDSVYIGTLCHHISFVIGSQITIKMIIVCISYVIGKHLKKVAR